MAFLGFTFIIFSIPSIFYKGEYSKNLNSFTGTHFANFKNCCSWTFVHYNSLFDNFLLFFNGIALFIVLTHLKYGSTPSRENLCPFLSPRCQNPVFYPVVRFFKKYIFGIYLLWGVSRCKNFPRQILSGIRFLQKSFGSSNFIKYII